MKFIKNLLKERGLFFKNSIEEYTDHFASMYEMFLLKYEEQQADIYIKVAINRLDAKQINKDYFKLHYKNKLIMTSTISLSFLLCILFFVPSDPPSINPMKYEQDQVSSTFGLRTHPIHKNKKLHKGIDIKANVGEEVVATSDGIVISAEYNEKNGYYIEIKHDETYSTKYLHLSKIHVEAGSKIKRGEKIGEVGSSGLSSQPHLHYEVIKNGKAVDPQPFLKV